MSEATMSKCTACGCPDDNPIHWTFSTDTGGVQVFRVRLEDVTKKLQDETRKRFPDAPHPAGGERDAGDEDPYEAGRRARAEVEAGKHLALYRTTTHFNDGRDAKHSHVVAGSYSEAIDVVFKCHCDKGLGPGPIDAIQAKYITPIDAIA